MNGLAVFATGIVSAGIVAAAITAPEINRGWQLDELRSSCWSQDAQTTFTKLATNVVREEVGAVAKSSGSNLARSDLDKATRVTAHSFHTIAVDEKAHAATCGATLDFTFTRRDGKTLHNDGSIVQFQIYPSREGSIYSTTQGAVYRQIVESAHYDD